MAVTMHVVEPDGDDAVWAMRQYFDEIDDRFEQGFDPGDALTTGLESMGPPGGAFVLARAGRGSIVGCGGVQTIGPDIGEVKRMWVAAAVRGRGVGRRLLRRLEAESRRLGHLTLRLDTNSQLPEAVALYKSAGYVEIERYNDNPYPDHFFEKDLTASP